MPNNKTSFTYLILILSFVLSGCAPVQVAPEARSIPPTSASSQEGVSKASPSTTSSPTQTAQDCSTLSLSEAVMAALGNMTGRSTSLSAIDPATGKQICGYASIYLGTDVIMRISPGQKYLAAINVGSGYGGSSKIQIVDLMNWNTFEVHYPFADIPFMVFSPDSSHLALAFQTRDSASPSNLLPSKLVMLDVQQGEVIADTELGFFPNFLQFTSDGNQIIAVGGPMYNFNSGEDSSNADLNAQGVVMDIFDLKSDYWQIPLLDILEGSLWTINDDNPSGLEYRSAVQLSPDGRYIYIVHASEDKLTTVDLKEKKVDTVNIQRKLSWIEHLLSFDAGAAYAKELNATYKEAIVSADGKNIFVLSLSMTPDAQKGFSLTTHGLQSIDTATGQEVARLDTAATHMALSSDSQQLYLLNYEEEKPWSEVVSTADLKTRAHFDGELLMSVRRQNGQDVLLISSQQGNGTKMTLLDPQTLQPSSSWFWKELNFEASPFVWP